MNSGPLPLPRSVGLVCVCVGGGGQSRRYNHPNSYNDPAIRYVQSLVSVSSLAGGAVATNAFHSYMYNAFKENLKERMPHYVSVS